jgi:ABC-type sugar transport system permease subunit
MVIGSITSLSNPLSQHVMTGGGPSHSPPLWHYVWKTLPRDAGGHAAAAAMVLFLVVMVITILQLLVGVRDNTR